MNGKPARSEKLTDEDGHLVVMGALGETFYLLSNQVIVGIGNYSNNDKDNSQHNTNNNCKDVLPALQPGDSGH